MIWAFLLKVAVADVPSVDDPRLNIEEKSSIVYRYVLEEARAEGEIFRLKDPVFHGMRWSKWGELSTYWELCTPLATGGAQASWGLVTAQVHRGDLLIDDATSIYRTNCPIGPNSCTADIHRLASTEVELLSPLEEGDEITIVLGDTEACFEQCDPETSDCSRCSNCGFETPDRSFSSVPLETEWCLNDNCQEGPSTLIEISAKPQIQNIWISTPSIIRPSEPFPLKVALLDYRGNPIPQASAQIRLADTSLAVSSDSHSFSPADGGWHDFLLKIPTEGIHRVEILDAQGNTYTAPPIWVKSTAEQTLYWGDIHVHHGWTTWTEDGERIDHNHSYARDVMGLDVVSESMKARGIEINPDALWAELQENCQQYTVEGEYLALLGFEWIGDVAAAADCGDNSCSQGHHNIYYADCDGQLGDLDANIIDGLEGTKGLWTWLQNGPSEYTSIPHAMQFTQFNYNARDPEHQSVAEIYSEWGDNSINLETAGSTTHMLSSGLRLGWIGGSDNHDGWMGNPESVKNTPSGLAAFWAEDLTHSSIFKSIKSRQTFATTGHRPILDFSIQDTNTSIMMGTTYIPHQPVVQIRYHATTAIQHLRLFSIEENETASRQLLWEGGSNELDLIKNITLEPSLFSVQNHAVAFWFEVLQSDGEKAWSSPIWLTNNCNDLEASDPLNICSGQPQDTANNDSLNPPEAQSPSPKSRCQLIDTKQSSILLFFSLLWFTSRREIDVSDFGSS